MPVPAISFRVVNAARRGFTLLELLVVMVIIGLLAAYVGPKYFAQLGKSEIKAAAAQLNSFEKALDQYRLDTGHYPANELGLVALFARPPNEPKWGGPYIQRRSRPILGDGPMSTSFPESTASFDLLSFGKDGQPGRHGEGADITKLVTRCNSK